MGLKLLNIFVKSVSTATIFLVKKYRKSRNPHKTVFGQKILLTGVIALLLNTNIQKCIWSSIVDRDPNWIRIQQICGSGSNKFKNRRNSELSTCAIISGKFIFKDVLK